VIAETSRSAVTVFAEKSKYTKSAMEKYIPPTGRLLLHNVLLWKWQEDYIHIRE
jgi:hypothetical protein